MFNLKDLFPLIVLKIKEIAVAKIRKPNSLFDSKGNWRHISNIPFSGIENIRYRYTIIPTKNSIGIGDTAIETIPNKTPIISENAVVGFTILILLLSSSFT